MEIIFKATIFPDCHTETAATPHPRTGTPPGETVKATGTTARATGIPIPPPQKRRGAIYDARTPEQRNAIKTPPQPPSRRKRRGGAIYDARTPERRNTTGPCARRPVTINADGRHKWRPHGTRNPQRRPLRTAADVGRAVLTSRKTGGFNLFLTGKATFQTILSVTLQRESSATGKTAKTRNRTIK